MMMKFFYLTLFLFIIAVLSGCNIKNNFMDVDNPHAKEDLKNIIGSGNIPHIDPNSIIPDELSGTRNNAKGYANKYYEDNLKGYVDTAKEGLSGTIQELKGQYNNGVDQLHGAISDKVNKSISGELNKFKIK